MDDAGDDDDNPVCDGCRDAFERADLPRLLLLPIEGNRGARASGAVAGARSAMSPARNVPRFSMISEVAAWGAFFFPGLCGPEGIGGPSDSCLDRGASAGPGIVFMAGNLLLDVVRVLVVVLFCRGMSTVLIVEL
jgi:hypothetical protein